MIIQFNDLHIISSQYCDKSEATHALNGIPDVVFVDGTFGTDHYHVIICRTPNGDLGVAIEGARGTIPSALFKDSYLVIGCGSKLCFIDLTQKRQLCEHHVNTFYQFITSNEGSDIIVMQETGVSSYTLRGGGLWHFETPDIITDWLVSDNEISLILFEGNELKIDRKTGSTFL